MIIDQTLVTQMAIGTDRRLPQEGDAQVVLPSVLSPVVLSLQTTRNHAAAVVANESLLTEVSRFNVNQAASNDLLATLPAGLYELEIEVAMLSDFVQVPASGLEGVRVLFNYGTSGFTLLGRFFAIGSFYDYARYRVLLPQTCTLEHRVAVTGAAQNVRSRSLVNIIRIL